VGNKDLEESIISKIKTTMIGAIADIEELDMDEDTFNAIRNSILDRGNNQIRLIKKELYDYKIVNVYRYNFRIKE
jgi:hypothetical protein